MKTIKIKRILVPVDFSDASYNAVNNALHLVKLLQAEIYLICVTGNSTNHFSKWIENQNEEHTLIDVDNAIIRKMNEMKKDIELKHGIMAHIHISTGYVYTEIVNFANAKQIDMIMMGTQGVTGMSEVIDGSNTQRVVTQSKVPVLSIQETCVAPQFKNILIPIDNSLHSREKVNMALYFGTLFNASMHIIGLLDSYDSQDIELFHIKIRSVEEIIDASGLMRTTTLVHAKHIAQAALDYGIENNCDLIVINTGHESEVNGFLLGAFAQHIVNHSSIPILSIKHTPSHYRMDSPGIPDF